MLKSLDILIGFAVIMLVLSMAVTVITQLVTSAVNLRGRNLLAGLASLLRQIDPETLPLPVARGIAAEVLSHPLIQGPTGRYGAVVEREELVRLLLDFAASPAHSKAMAALNLALSRTGIKDPAAVIDEVRQMALKLEASNPELPTHARQALALAVKAESEFLARINGWFDQTMDRVAQRFSYHARIVTSAAALLVAVGLQMDALGILNRLSVDDQLRNSLVAHALQQASASAPADALSHLEKTALGDLVAMPESFTAWRQGWTGSSAIGVIFTAMLLSLGAPFWYNALKNLVGLRPQLAAKDDAQRQQRQGAQT
jgi:hypothetical protein